MHSSTQSSLSTCCLFFSEQISSLQQIKNRGEEELPSPVIDGDVGNVVPRVLFFFFFLQEAADFKNIDIKLTSDTALKENMCRTGDNYLTKSEPSK